MLKWEMIEMQQKYMVLILLNTKNVKKLSKKRKLNCHRLFYRFITKYPVHGQVVYDLFFQERWIAGYCDNVW